VRSAGGGDALCVEEKLVRDSVANMDLNVYAGCMEQIDNEFWWPDAH
jgi:hypothetical protein